MDSCTPSPFFNSSAFPSAADVCGLDAATIARRHLSTRRIVNHLKAMVLKGGGLAIPLPMLAELNNDPTEMRILVAEDEPSIAHHVKQGLEEASCAVDLAEDGDEAVWMASNTEYDVLVFDVMMPRKDGFAAIKELRRKGVQTPAIMLTARGEVEDRVRGLDAGADDYMIKPFSIAELQARIRALLRRQRGNVSNILRVEDLELDLISRTARRAGRHIELTNREFALLEILMTASPRPVSKSAIVEHVWDQHFDSGTNVVNVYIRHLREKVECEGEPPLLHTIRGLGFVLKAGEPQGGVR